MKKYILTLALLNALALQANSGIPSKTPAETPSTTQPATAKSYASRRASSQNKPKFKTKSSAFSKSSLTPWTIGSNPYLNQLKVIASPTSADNPNGAVKIIGFYEATSKKIFVGKGSMNTTDTSCTLYSGSKTDEAAPGKTPNATPNKTAIGTLTFSQNGSLLSGEALSKILKDTAAISKTSISFTPTAAAIDQTKAQPDASSNTPTSGSSTRRRSSTTKS